MGLAVTVEPRLMAPTGTESGATPEGATVTPVRSGPRPRFARARAAPRGHRRRRGPRDPGPLRRSTVRCPRPVLGFPWATFAGQRQRIAASRPDRHPGGRTVAPDPVRAAVRRHRLLRWLHHVLHLAVETVQRGQHGRVGLAAGYVAASLVAGMAAAVLGHGPGPRVTSCPSPETGPIPDPDDLGPLSPGADPDEDAAVTVLDGGGGRCLRCGPALPGRPRRPADVPAPTSRSAPWWST